MRAAWEWLWKSIAPHAQSDPDGSIDTAPPQGCLLICQYATSFMPRTSP